MSKLTAAQIDDLKRRNPCHEVAGQYVALRPGSSKFGPGGFTGPCPLHSRDAQARDSTSFECSAEGWVCASCQDGGDVIKLVALASGLDPERDFRRALALLPNAGVAADPAELERAEAWRQERDAQRQADQNEWRERARGRAWDLWERAGPAAGRYYVPFAGSAGERYLREARGLDVPAGIKLRFDPSARYYVEDRPKWRLVHTGWAIVAAIQREGHFLGCHRTFIDLAQPKGKARIVDPKTGLALNPKTMHGAKKGGHIDLTGCKLPTELVLGEGMEKVLAVWSAFSAGGRDTSAIAFWSAGDLGNMGGKADKTVPHPLLKSDKGRTVRVPGPMPDLESPGILIPETVRKVILLADSTSDRFTTQCAMARALLRFKAQQTDVDVVAAWGPEGKDFDDVLRGAG